MRTLIAMLIAALLVVPVVAVGLSGFMAVPLGPGDADDSPAVQVAAPPSADDDAKTDTDTDANTDSDTDVRIDVKPDPKTDASPTYSRSGYEVTPLSRERVAELAKKLDPEAYRITQKAGTEPAFCGTLLDNKKDGIYCCVVCGLPLFSSAHKFNSGTGWPSFFTTLDRAHVAGRPDGSHGMERIEINCARCDAHLGHVFDDGPKPSGLRFCLNGASLRFYEKDEARPPESMPVATETAYFAGGCFWGIEHYFQLAPGVVGVESGYMQGSSPNPDYKEVCTQDDVPPSRRPADFRPHAEAVRVTFDPKAISYRDLLRGFFEMHDPTQLDRQGPDEGTQYRSGIYCANEAQRAEAKAFVAELAARKPFGGRAIVTEIELAKPFHVAEEYHQDYLEKNPSRGCHIGKPWWLTTPKVAPGAPAASR